MGAFMLLVEDSHTINWMEVDKTEDVARDADKPTGQVLDVINELCFNSISLPGNKNPFVM